MGNLIKLVALAVIYSIVLTLAYLYISPFFEKLNLGILLGDELYLHISRTFTLISNPNIDEYIPTPLKKPYIYFTSSVLLWLITAITISPRKITHLISKNKYKILLAGMMLIIFGIVITLSLWNYPLNTTVNNINAVLTLSYFIGFILLEIGFPVTSIALFIFISVTLIRREL